MDDVLFNYPDGAPKYRGDIKNGRMEGKGEYFFENGNGATQPPPPAAVSCPPAERSHVRRTGLPQSTSGSS